MEAENSYFFLASRIDISYTPDAYLPIIAALGICLDTLEGCLSDFVLLHNQTGDKGHVLRLKIVYRQVFSWHIWDRYYRVVSTWTGQRRQARLDRTIIISMGYSNWQCMDELKKCYYNFTLFING